MLDPKIKCALEKEEQRQIHNIELIASENFVSAEVELLAGSLLTNKYAEGYPGKRYYGGCEFVDEVEEVAIHHLKQLYGCEHANVQPHSGSQANMAVYMGVLQPNDVVLGMALADGGHLTHGHPMNFSGKLYHFVSYGVDPQTQYIDYEQVRTLALKHRPKMIVAGASAYSRIIDFQRFKAIADEVGAYLMVDMAHIAGLVAAKVHPSPVPYADFVTSTTHKTLRGPRGGFILCKSEYAKQIDASVFPGIQGGPLMHIIAAKAQCFYEALQPEFEVYQQQVIDNMQAMVAVFKKHGIVMVSGGSDNHLLVLDVYSAFGISGKEAEDLLHKINITCNKNALPQDPLPPAKASGIRIGTAAMTSKGLHVNEFTKIAEIIVKVLTNKEDYAMITSLKQDVEEIVKNYDLIT